MATRSTIAIEHADGTVEQVYCHWDGYLEYNGRLLLEYWNSQDKLEQLIALGDLSSLGQAIGEQHEFGDNVEGYCKFYGRDRGETGTEARQYADFDSYQKECQIEEFNYILRQDGAWHYFTSQPTRMHHLTAELFEEEI